MLEMERFSQMRLLQVPMSHALVMIVDDDVFERIGDPRCFRMLDIGDRGRNADQALQLSNKYGR